jgi:hypothetical protein
MIGATPMTCVSCNGTTMVLSTPAGTGVLGSISLTVGGQTAIVSPSVASVVFMFAPPSIVSLVSVRRGCGQSPPPCSVNNTGSLLNAVLIPSCDSQSAPPLPTIGWTLVSNMAAPSNVTLVGTNFGPTGSSLLVTFASGVGGWRACVGCGPGGVADNAGDGGR